MGFLALTKNMKDLIYKKRHIVTGIILGLLGLYPVLFGEFELISLVLIVLAAGNFLKNDWARKFTIAFYFLVLILVVFLFFPPFTDSNEVIMYEYSTAARVLAMIGIELLILLLSLLLRTGYTPKAFQQLHKLKR